MARKKVTPEQDVVFEEEGSYYDPDEAVEPVPAKPAPSPRSRSSGSRSAKSKTAEAKAAAEARAAEADGPPETAPPPKPTRSRSESASRAEAGRAEAGRVETSRVETGRAETSRGESRGGPVATPEPPAAARDETPRTPHAKAEYEPVRSGSGRVGSADRSDSGAGGDSETEGWGAGTAGDFPRTADSRSGDFRGDDNRGPGEPGDRRRKRRRRRPKKGAARQSSPPMQQPQQQQQQPRGRRGRHGGHRGSGGGGGGGFHSAPDESLPTLGVHEGVLELHPKGYGFLRDPKNNFASTKFDPFVAASMIEKNKLREGVLIRGEIIPGNKGQGPRLKNIESVEGRTLEENLKIRPFEELTAVNPFERIRLETGPNPVTMRVLDLLTPLGKGQRALIVAPPRTGKTMLLQDIANAVSVNHPEMHLIVLLIDERPEEVTEMRRRVRGEVIASSMDRDVESHVRISQLIVERGKRIAEAGGQVFILLDSITRTARAFNKWIGNTGRTMTGGLDVKAMDIPKKMFGTARRFDEGGSLTVVGTALIDTGSRMDEVIFQEFKGTGNMELVLNRQLADRRIWPSIDITLSGTRREELILTPEELEGVTILRRSLVSMNPVEAMEQLVKTLQRFPTNREFLSKIRAIL